MQVKEEPTAAGATPPPAGERPERSCVCVESGDAVVEECLLSSEVYPPRPPTCTKVNQPPRRLSLPGCPTRPLLAGPVTPRAPTWAAGLWWQVGYGLMVCGSATPTVSLCTVSRCSQVTPPLPPGPHRRNVCTHNLKTHECT